MHDNVYETQTWEPKDRDQNKYVIDSDLDWQIFSDSRKNYDQVRNNIIHFVFSMRNSEKEIRDRYLKVCIEEHIGSLTIRNLSNYLPH